MAQAKNRGLRQWEYTLLRVLGYQEEDGEWAAHCLETDLVGYGPGFEQALRQLRELTDMQFSFAVFKGQPSLLSRPAPLHIIETYNFLMSQVLQSFPNSLPDPSHVLGSMPIPKPRKRPREFAPTSA
jgi:hypothetical protein